jgi:TetR/AcrR family transcriptional repressor of nem operon
MSKGALTRREILRKAAPLFNQKGFEGTAMSDLMQATGLQKGGIYRHFESKEQLASEAFDYAWKLAIDLRLTGAGEIPDSVDRLKQIVRNFRERRSGLVPGGCPLMNTAIESDDGNARLRGKARKALNFMLDRLSSTAKEGRVSGEIRVEIDPCELASLIVATLEGGLMLSRLQKKDAPLDLACRHLEEYLEKAVRKVSPSATEGNS